MTKNHTILGLIDNYIIVGLILIFATQPRALIGQYGVQINFVDQSHPSFEELTSKINKLSDSLSIQSLLLSNIDNMRNEGYLSSSLDQMYLIDSVWNVDIYVGQRYKLAKLDVGDVEQGIIDESDIRLLDIENQYLSPENFNKVFNELIEKLENNGYPFATAKLSETKIEENNLQGTLKINKGKKILIDSLNVYGRATISTSYLEQYLDIHPDDRYSKEKILDIKSKLSDLPFLDLNTNPTINFFEDKAVVNLELEPKNASRFDFIFGLLQNDSNEGERYTFIFDATAEMLNKLGFGEYFYLQFKRLKPEVQELDAKLNFPYLFDLPFGIDASFSLFRNATTNIDVISDLGIQYFISANNYVKFSWDFSSSRLLELDTARILQRMTLPDRLDVNYNALGLGAYLENLDYRFNPRKGYKLNLESSIGLKAIKANRNILELSNEFVDFEQAYDTLSNDKVQWELNMEASYFIPLGDRATLMTGVQSGFKLPRERLFRNEFFRLGGSKLLRGFDEQSILSDMYSIFNLEYRLLLSQNSYLSAFADYGYVRSGSGAEEDWQRPFGIGAGLNFETGAGVFGISTAVGRTRDIPLNFRNAKIHFGFISLF